MKKKGLGRDGWWNSDETKKKIGPVSWDCSAPMICWLGRFLCKRAPDNRWFPFDFLVRYRCVEKKRNRTTLHSPICFTTELGGRDGRRVTPQRQLLSPFLISIRLQSVFDGSFLSHHWHESVRFTHLLWNTVIPGGGHVFWCCVDRADGRESTESD